MSAGPTFRLRPIRRGDYEIEADGKLVVLLSLQNDLPNAAASARTMLAALAEFHGGTVDSATSALPHGKPEQDWEALGWSDKDDHDRYLAEVHQSIEAWHGNPIEQSLRAHVNIEKRRAGIPKAPPFSFEQLVALERIISRAPAIVAQDLAAEGPAA